MMGGGGCAPWFSQPKNAGHFLRQRQSMLPLLISSVRGVASEAGLAFRVTGGWYAVLPVPEDNERAIQLAKNPTMSSKSKHI